MTFRMRAGALTDLPWIEVGERSYIDLIEPANTARWLAALDRNRELWAANTERTIVLEMDGTPAGYVMWSSSGPDATLVTIGVRAEDRRRGLGSALLQAFVERALADGHRFLRLGVHRDNPAQRLYTAAGFEQSGTEGEYLLMSRAAG